MLWEDSLMMGLPTTAYCQNNCVEPQEHHLNWQQLIQMMWPSC